MKQKHSYKHTNRRVLFALLCVLAFLAPVLCFAADTFHLAAFEYPPFYTMEKEGIQGIGADLASELFTRLGLQVKIHFFPLKRALNAMEEGFIDGQMILIKTTKRQEYISFTRPVLIVRGLIWSVPTRTGGPVNFSTLEELRKYTIGVTRGYSYGQKFDAFLDTMRVDVASRDFNNYMKLLSGRIDIFPGNEIVAKGLFKRYPNLQGKFVHSETSFIEWILRMGISKKSKLILFLPQINEIISAMEKDGFIEKTVKKYIE